MLRRLHSLPGLLAALLVAFMAITGAVLSVQPLVDRLSTASAAAGLTVAELAARVVAQVPGVESLSRSASGAIMAQAGSSAVRIEPTTGEDLGPVAGNNPVFAFFTELHRSLFLGDNGHILAGLAAAAMVVLAVSGVLLLVNRMGGWRRIFARTRGTLSQRLHVELARLAVFGLLLSAVTAVYMTLATFGLVGDGAAGFAFAPAGSGGTPAPIASLAALEAVPLADLRELVLPLADDPTDVFTLTTSSGVAHIDQATGAIIDFTANSPLQTLYEAIYTLHTGQGHWWLGLLLGMASLAVPALMVTGIVIWAVRRRSRPRLARNTSWRRADTVVLVGSEGHTTWGFAAALEAGLRANGHAVHVAPMNAVRRHYPAARRLLVLTATYGTGSAPASANRFLDRLRHLDGRNLDFAVLGFGDRKFRDFCRFAEVTRAALAEHGLPELAPYAAIDRQSSQGFAQWGRTLGAALGEELVLVHEPERPATRPLMLLDRTDYGVEVQAPTTVLRFVLPPASGILGRVFGRIRFAAGDLVGIVPPGERIPRYYSIASDSRDGVLEIAVRKMAGGVCSNMLFALAPGDTVEAFIRPNPDFRPAGGRRPLILVGAGTGVAPLAGFVRANAARRPIHLYFGGRDPASDFLYGAELSRALDTGRLDRLRPAFSRVLGGGYVQDRILGDADELRRLLARGAQVLVCGGASMAQGVRSAFDVILAPAGLGVDALREKGRYIEDVY